MPPPKMRKALVRLQDTTRSILKEKHTGDNVPRYFSHYTNWDALKSILSGSASNHMRLCHVAYFNDRLEGAVFPSELDDQCEFIYGRKDEIPHEINAAAKTFSVYVCAFSGHDDRLDMWRAYGNDGDGYSITVAIPDRLKTDEKIGAIKDMFDKSHPAKDADAKSVAEKIRIYKVLYGDAVKDTVAKILPHLQELQSALLQINDKLLSSKAIIVAQSILADLRYLYKHEAFETEDEYRIIRFAEFRDKNLEPDDRTPPRFFIKTSPFLFLENGCKIIIGPRVADNAAADIYIRRQLSTNKWDSTTTVTRSNMPYR